jgi:hypothetical protein
MIFFVSFTYSLCSHFLTAHLCTHYATSSRPRRPRTPRSRTLTLEGDAYAHGYLAEVAQLQRSLRAIEEACRPGCAPNVLDVASRTLATLTEVIRHVEPRAKL